MGRYLEAEELLKDMEKDEARFVKTLWQDVDSSKRAETGQMAMFLLHSISFFASSF